MFRRTNEDPELGRVPCRKKKTSYCKNFNQNRILTCYDETVYSMFCPARVFKPKTMQNYFCTFFYGP